MRRASATLDAGAESAEDLEFAHSLVPVLTEKAGLLLWNQWPTGVSVTHAQEHGGPYPATTAVTTTAMGAASITRPASRTALPPAAGRI